MRKWNVRLAWVLLPLLAIGPAVAQRVEPPRQTPTKNANRPPQKKASIMPINSNAQSLILRSTHILLIRIESTEVGPWVPEEGAPTRRTIAPRLIVEEVLQGTLLPKPSQPILVQATQARRVGTRFYALPGVWSEHDVGAGTRLVAFSLSPSNVGADVLSERHLQRLMDPQEALGDVRRVVEAERKTTSISDLLTLANRNLAGLGFLFADYVADRIETSGALGAPELDALRTHLELPGLSAEARSTLLGSVNSILIATDPVPPPVLERWVTTLFRLIALPGAVDADNIIQVYLPNVVGISGGVKPKKASAVFTENPAERQRAREILGAYQGPATKAKLLEWLQE